MKITFWFWFRLLLLLFVLFYSPWYNRNGWLGVKHQLTCFVLLSVLFYFAKQVPPTLKITSSRGALFFSSNFPIKMVGKISSPNVRSHKVGRRDELARALVVFVFRVAWSGGVTPVACCLSSLLHLSLDWACWSGPVCMKVATVFF